jgi:hypothetical protein
MVEKITASPSWLEISEDQSTFILTPERANIVRLIFEYSRDGMGGYTIANQLNAEGVQPFGPSPKWQQSTINNMLRNRAVLGEHQPRRLEGSKRVPYGAPIPTYYPAVIDEDLFDAVQSARKRHLTSHRGRKGATVSNLFSGLACCAYCNGRMKLKVNIGRVAYKGGHLVCSNAYSSKGCSAVRWRYVDFETALLSFIEDLEPASPVSTVQQEIVQIPREYREATDNFLSRSRIAARLKTLIHRLAVATRRSPERYIAVTLRGRHQFIVYPDRPR